MNETITVTFQLEDGSAFSGDVPRLAIVHEAMEKLLPHGFLKNKRISITQPHSGDLIYPDMFCGEIHDQYGAAVLHIAARALPEPSGAPRAWRNVGFDHLALSMADRRAAVDFFTRGLGMVVMRDDEHLAVLSAPNGNNALFLFEAEAGKPLSDGVPSRIHHIGFVVDDLEAAYQHLRANFPAFTSDFTLLERLERWSLYGKISFGGITFMIQLSQIKDAYRGFPDPKAYADLMYDYSSRHYGVRFMPG
jgi:Glyoxalase/Bleomycin resistance protein/Dioxygenase superfamily.